jgi:DNA repair protein RecN (Recombination protein N)
MLVELRIRNYAVIDRATVQVGPGLNVLTGETGAGKSIIVGALSLLLGERASADVVRAGADRALVEAVFDLAGRPDLAALLAEQGIDAEDGLLLLRREVTAGGRSRAWVNGSPSTAGWLGELGRRLVDLHGQHEHQTLLRTDEQRAILDAFAGADGCAAELRAAHAAHAAARRRLEELEKARAEAEQRADFLRFQAEEIEAARLRPDEEELLAAEALRLGHADELARLSGLLHDGLYAAEDALAARVAELRRTLAQLLRIDPALAEHDELLETAYFNLEEVGHRMGEYASRVEHDPARLEEVRQRQELIFRLRSKYGGDLAVVLETGRRAREELDLLDRAHLERGELERAVVAAHATLEQAAAALTRLRSDAAARLEAEVVALLPALGLTGGRFQVALTPHATISAAGAEGVEFRVALNAGFDPRPLARVASGGELSRIMLALKTILAAVDRVPTLVFDEIDVGIGGRVALQVADRLHQVARSHQVFVISHLAQIASRADRQLLVEKSSGEDVSARVIELAGEARVRELARMLGGDPGSEAGLQHARELLGSRV